MLRSLILAFTGERTAAVLEEPEEAIMRTAAVTAMQALDSQVGAGWQVLMLPVAAYQVMWGAD